MYRQAFNISKTNYNTEILKNNFSRMTVTIMARTIFNNLSFSFPCIQTAINFRNNDRADIGTKSVPIKVTRNIFVKKL